MGIGRGHLKSPERREIDPKKIQDAFALVGTARKDTGVLKNGVQRGWAEGGEEEEGRRGEEKRAF